HSHHTTPSSTPTNTLPLHDALPICDPQRTVAVAVGQLVDHQVLRAAQHTSRDLAPHHELVRRLGVRAALRAPLVPILLLIRTVELEELRALVRDVRGTLGELGGDLPAQAVALLLDSLDSAQRL